MEKTAQFFITYEQLFITSGVLINRLMSEVENKIDAEKMGKIAKVLKVISHPVRLEVIELLLAKGELSVGVIKDTLDIEQSLLSHHLTKMRQRGVLASSRQGKHIFYSVAISEIATIFNCMRHCNL